MKRIFLIILIISCANVISCTTTDYVGKTYSKTDRVEILSIGSINALSHHTHHH